MNNKGKKIKHVLISQIMDCEGFEARSHFISRLSKIIRANVVLNRTAAAVVSCMTSVDGIKLWLLSRLLSIKSRYHWSSVS